MDSNSLLKAIMDSTSPSDMCVLSSELKVSMLLCLSAGAGMEDGRHMRLEQQLAGVHDLAPEGVVVEVMRLMRVGKTCNVDLAQVNVVSPVVSRIQCHSANLEKALHLA